MTGLESENTASGDLWRKKYELTIGKEQRFLDNTYRNGRDDDSDRNQFIWMGSSSR